MNKRIIVFALLMLLMLVMVSLAQAQDCGCVPEEYAVANVNVDFACDKLTVSWSHPVGLGSIVVFGTIDDVLDFQLIGGSSGTYTWDFNPPASPDDVFAIVILILGETEDGGELLAAAALEINCGDTQEEDDGLPECGDGRVTYTLCQPLAVFPMNTEDGIGWSIYMVSRGSDEGQFMLYIPAATFDSLPDEVPANCTIAHSESGEVVVYLLTSGQYQINIGPDEEGKVFAYIFDDLNSAPVRIDTMVSGMLPEILPACG